MSNVQNAYVTINNQTSVEWSPNGCEMYHGRADGQGSVKAFTNSLVFHGVGTFGAAVGVSGYAQWHNGKASFSVNFDCPWSEDNSGSLASIFNCDSFDITFSGPTSKSDDCNLTVTIKAKN